MSKKVKGFNRKMGTDKEIIIKTWTFPACSLFLSIVIIARTNHMVKLEKLLNHFISSHIFFFDLTALNHLL